MSPPAALSRVCENKNGFLPKEEARMPVATGANVGPTVKLSNGDLMPKMGFGTWGIAKDDVDVAIRAAAAAGYRLYDLAT